jgi:hypothetical protein
LYSILPLILWHSQTHTHKQRLPEPFTPFPSFSSVRPHLSYTHSSGHSYTHTRTNTHTHTHSLIQPACLNTPPHIPRLTTTPAFMPRLPAQGSALPGTWSASSATRQALARSAAGTTAASLDFGCKPAHHFPSITPLRLAASPRCPCYCQQRNGSPAKGHWRLSSRSWQRSSFVCVCMCVCVCVHTLRGLLECI